MTRKTPSSLDYETLLHELALKNWRRALVAGDFPRAVQNAEKLARSTDRFWRWQGHLDLATTHLSKGASERALDALENAKAEFPDIGALRAPALEVQVHVLLATGRPHDVLEIHGPETPLFRYHRALGFARLSRPDEAAKLDDQTESDSLLSSAIRAEVFLSQGRPHRAIEILRRALSTDLTRSTTSSGLRTPVLSTLGEALIEVGEHKDALGVFEDIEKLPDALLSWPIPYVRSHYHRGRIQHELGDRTGAHKALETFLRFWSGCDFDRERVERAAQLVNA